MGHVYARSGVWWLQWNDVAGKRQRRGSTAKSRREAQGLLAEIEAQVQRVLLGLQEAPVATRLTLQQLLEWYLDERCPEASREMARAQVKKHVFKSELAAYPLPLLNPDLIEAKVLEPMDAAKLAPATVNRLRTIMHAAFEAAALPPRRWSGRNPVSATRVRTVVKKERATLTPGQVEQVLHELRDSPWLGVMATAAYLGLRRGEIFALRKRDYDREAQTLMVAGSHQRSTTKSGKVATLPVPPMLKPYLDRARRSPGFLLFPNADGTMRTREADPHLVLRRALVRIGLAPRWTTYCLTCQRAKRLNEQVVEGGKKPEAKRCAFDGHLRRAKPELPADFNFHSLRHTCASNLLRAGVPLTYVSRILRHSGIRITADIYGHLEVEDLRSAFQPVTGGAQSSATIQPQKEVKAPNT